MIVHDPRHATGSQVSEIRTTRKHLKNELDVAAARLKVSQVHYIPQKIFFTLNLCAVYSHSFNGHPHHSLVNTIPSHIP